MLPLIEIIASVFGLVALGYLAGATGYIRTETGDALSEFAVGVAMPLLLFRTMLGADFHGSAPWAFWAAYFSAAAAAWTAGHLTTTRIFGRDSEVGVVGGAGAAFSNLVLLGIPFTQRVYGEEGFAVLSLLLAVHLPAMIMASIILFHVFGQRSGRQPLSPFRILRDFTLRMLKNPLVAGILLGLFWRLAGLPLPGLANRLIEALSGVAGPVALFAMGLGLRKFGISGNARQALALSAIKLFLLPAAALGTALLFDLPPLTAKVAIAAASLPSGVNSYLIAVQFGVGQALASNLLIIATSCAVATTAFWLLVAQVVFG
jgi:predicted permease